jgi:hypothetical protein
VKYRLLHTPDTYGWIYVRRDAASGPTADANRMRMRSTDHL